MKERDVMRKNAWILWVLITTTVAVSTSAWAEHTRVTNPNALNVEFLGRGMLYSVNYDRVVNDDIVAGFGFGSTPLSYPDGTGAGVSTALIPVWASYYFAREQGSFYVTGGADIVTNTGAVSGLKSTFGNIAFNANPVLPYVGVGYENRGDSGFLFRVAVYGILTANVYPWGGLSAGYAF
jgi:hypothetical protein